MVKKNLGKIQIDTVLAAGYIAPFLERANVFNGIGFSERRIRSAGKSTRGALQFWLTGPQCAHHPLSLCGEFPKRRRLYYPPDLCHHDPLAEIPFLLFSYFPAGAVCGQRHVPPGIFAQPLLLKIAESESETPFPIFMEAIVLHFLYEIMREAGLRVPRPLTHAVSIVGALVIGDAAVSSGLVGAPTLMVIALTAIASYVTPSLYEVTAILRLVFIILGATIGCGE